MKVTLEIPDELYRQVKAKSALEGKPVRAVAEALFRRYVEGLDPAESDRGSSASGDDSLPLGQEAPPWFGVLKPFARRGKTHDWEAIQESIARSIAAN